MTTAEPPLAPTARPACAHEGGTAREHGSVAMSPKEASQEESSQERVNRRWQEILQETRVAQTGVQILFGFLLSVAFTARFQELGAFGRTVYVLTVALGALATATLIAPVSLHRFLSGQRMKDEVIRAAGRLMVCGMVLLALTIGGTLLLILNVVIPAPLANIITGVVMLWFILCWYALPYRLHRKGRRSSTPSGTSPQTVERD